MKAKPAAFGSTRLGMSPPRELAKTLMKLFMGERIAFKPINKSSVSM